MSWLQAWDLQLCHCWKQHQSPRLRPGRKECSGVGELTNWFMDKYNRIRGSGKHRPLLLCHFPRVPAPAGAGGDFSRSFSTPHTHFRLQGPSPFVRCYHLDSGALAVEAGTKRYFSLGGSALVLTESFPGIASQTAASEARAAEAAARAPTPHLYTAPTTQPSGANR
jgi:hypothetical protein